MVCAFYLGIHEVSMSYLLTKVMCTFYHGVCFLLWCSWRQYIFVTNNVHLDPLVTVVSAGFLHWKVTVSSIVNKFLGRYLNNLLGLLFLSLFPLNTDWDLLLYLSKWTFYSWVPRSGQFPLFHFSEVRYAKMKTIDFKSSVWILSCVKLCKLLNFTEPHIISQN